MNPNYQKMMRQVQKMQADMAKMQEDLANEVVEASAGGGMVTEASRALGLHRAMYVIPAIGIVLSFVLFVAASTSKNPVPRASARGGFTGRGSTSLYRSSGGGSRSHGLMP